MEDRLRVMGVLADLSLDTGAGSVLLIEPPPPVLLEAGSLKPRPGVSPSVQTARPAETIAWWPSREQVTAATLGRLAWLASAAHGAAWVVVDPGEADSPTLAEVRAAISPGGLVPGEERRLSSGEVALRLE